MGDRRHRVVIVGGGFGGLLAARRLGRAPVDVTLIDRQNYHLFQPLAYQVAIGGLSPAEVAAPLRAVLKRQRNTDTVLAEVTGFDLAGRRVLLADLPDGRAEAAWEYDTLIVAAGSQYTYFGHDDWRPYAPDLKSLDHATEVRNRILTAFEAAELEPDGAARAAWLTFVVVGGGPTGVEMAGQIAELARETLRRDYRAADTRSARVLLVETTDRLLAGFPPTLSERARRSLERLGVTPLLGRAVTDVSGSGVRIAAAGGEPEAVAARTVVWAAGVVASPLAGLLAAQAGLEPDRAGRVPVRPDLTLPGHPEVLALGDMVRVEGADGQPADLPGLAPVAMQQGRYAARVVRDRLAGRRTAPFRYRDKGNLATIGRSKAVADVKGLHLSGFPAWMTWLVVHLFYLIGFQNRLLVLVRWTISFFTRGRGARTITGRDGQR